MSDRQGRPPKSRDGGRCPVVIVEWGLPHVRSAPVGVPAALPASCRIRSARDYFQYRLALATTGITDASAETVPSPRRRPWMPPSRGATGKRDSRAQNETVQWFAAPQEPDCNRGNSRTMTMQSNVSDSACAATFAHVPQADAERACSLVCACTAPRNDCSASSTPSPRYRKSPGIDSYRAWARANAC